MEKSGLASMFLWTLALSGGLLFTAAVVMDSFQRDPTGDAALIRPPPPPAVGGVTIRNPLVREEEEKRCVITIAGRSYDVSELRRDHPGGDVFECGTDMTEIFQFEHPGEWDLLDPYRVPSHQGL